MSEGQRVLLWEFSKSRVGRSSRLYSEEYSVFSKSRWFCIPRFSLPPLISSDVCVNWVFSGWADWWAVVFCVSRDRRGCCSVCSYGDQEHLPSSTLLCLGGAPASVSGQALQTGRFTPSPTPLLTVLPRSGPPYRVHSGAHVNAVLMNTCRCSTLTILPIISSNRVV